MKNAARKCREKTSRKWGINKDLKMGGGINKGFWPKYIPLVPDQKLQVRLI